MLMSYYQIFGKRRAYSVYQVCNPNLERGINLLGPKKQSNIPPLINVPTFAGTSRSDASSCAFVQAEDFEGRSVVGFNESQEAAYAHFKLS